MRRIAIALTLLALVAGLHACAADAPTKPPAGGGGQPSTALQIQLFTSDANPKAGTCTLVEAVVTLNGNPVPDGTGVSFTTDFGTFSQNGLGTVSVVTTNGASVTALCGPGAGSARVKASATVSGKTGSASLTIAFQPDSGTLPFVASCSPSLGNKAGGDSLALNGGRFFGTAATTRVQFTVNGVTRDGIVQSVTATQVIVQTPGFPELAPPSNPASVTLTLGTNLPSPVVLSLPTCFTFGTADSATPQISAILPSVGTNEGNTRVTIIGSGFATSGVQVFFGAVEAQVLSVNFNQILALSPPAFGVGAPNLNATIDVTVRNIKSGIASNGVLYRYAPGVQLTSIGGFNIQPSSGPFSPVTIFGQGFQAPVAVGLAGVTASVQSVSATEIVALPGAPRITTCNDISGAVTVTNINSGDTAAGLTFTYAIAKISVSGVNPNNDHPNGQVQAITQTTVLGSGFQNIGQLQVKFGVKTALIDSGTPNSLLVEIPPGTVTTFPACENNNPPNTFQVVETVDVTVTDTSTTCSSTAAQSFSYLLPCVVPTVTPTPTITPIPTVTP